MASWIFANAHAMFATSITASERQRAIACTAGAAHRKLSMRRLACFGASRLNDRHCTGKTEQCARLLIVDFPSRDTEQIVSGAPSMLGDSA